MGAIPTLGAKNKERNMNCKKCDEPLTESNFKSYLARAKKKYCNTCWSNLNAKTVSDIRRKIFEHYGTICAGCADDSFDSLQLDHIGGDGKANRLELMGKNKAGYPFYRKIIQLNYPEGFQTLCKTCNAMKQNLPNEEFITHIQRILKVHSLKK